MYFSKALSTRGSLHVEASDKLRFWEHQWVVIALLDSLKIQEAVPDFADCMLGAAS